MSDIEYLNEFYKHISTDSILVVTATGDLIRLYCPFEVKASVAFPEIEQGTIVKVERVQVTKERNDVYIIDGKGYLAIYFQIFINPYLSVHPSSQ